MEDTYNYIDAEYMLKMERKCDKIDEDWFRIATTYKTLYRLDSETALYLLARISATAIHYTQKGCISPEERDAVENRFMVAL